MIRQFSPLALFWLDLSPFHKPADDPPSFKPVLEVKSTKSTYLSRKGGYQQTRVDQQRFAAVTDVLVEKLVDFLLVGLGLSRSRPKPRDEGQRLAKLLGEEFQKTVTSAGHGFNK